MANILLWNVSGHSTMFVLIIDFREVSEVKSSEMEKWVNVVKQVLLNY